ELVATAAERAVVEQLALDAAHDRGGDVGPGAEHERHPIAESGHLGRLGRANDVQSARNTRGRLEIDRLDVVADVAVHTVVVRDVRRLEKAASPERAVDARRVAVRARAEVGGTRVARSAGVAARVER